MMLGLDTHDPCVLHPGGCAAQNHADDSYEGRAREVSTTQPRGIVSSLSSFLYILKQTLAVYLGVCKIAWRHHLRLERKSAHFLEARALRAERHEFDY
jgi:hypothetical protein